MTVRRRPLVRSVGYYKRCGALGEPSDTDDRSNAFFAFLTLRESPNVYETRIAMRVGAAAVDDLLAKTTSALRRAKPLVGYTFFETSVRSRFRRAVIFTNEPTHY